MLILASKSQTRVQLLQNAGYQFEAIPARIDEREVEERAQKNSPTQSEMTIELAKAKAIDVSKTHPQALVIGADQTLQFNDKYLHKSANFEALRQQLERLRGQTHMLCSSAVLVKNGEVLWTTASTSKMTMRAFSDQERDQVIELEGEKLLKSVGGYRLEGPSIRLFEKIDGDYFTILGLPLLPLVAALNTYLSAQ